MNKMVRVDRPAVWITTLCFLLLIGLIVRMQGLGVKESSDAVSWRADHHMHLASADLCRLVSECLPSNHPPAVFASDAVRALDQAHVLKGVILSCAYLYGLPSLHLTPREIAERTRRENEFTAAEVSKYPARLVGFLSVSPLQDSAIDEVRHWQGSHELIGLKLHFTASAVNIRSASERRRVAQVVSEAAAEHIPIVIHIGGGKVDASDAELFIRDVLPSAGDSWVQIAHAGGGLPLHDGNHVGVLRTFADHIVRDDPATRHVLFDLSFVPAPGESREDAAALTQQIRRIGMRRFLFASDFNVLTLDEEIKNLERLGLTKEEWQTLRENCAPWACLGTL
jgi:predicted TIM-barrel fold metal-dependent hydrolase